MTRRSKGEGSIFYRKDREQWVAQLKLEDGKCKTRSAKTRAQARELLRQMQREWNVPYRKLQKRGSGSTT